MSKYIVYTKEKGKIETDNYDDFKALTSHREDGPAIQKFHNNGKLEYVGYYINDKQHRLDGPAYQQFNDNGKLEYVGYYINDKEFSFKQWQAKVKPKTVEVDSKADLEKQVKKDKGNYIDGSDYYVSTAGNKPIVYTIKESNVFESFTEFYDTVNEAKTDFMATLDKTSVIIKGIKDDDIRDKVGDKIYTGLQSLLKDCDVDFSEIIFKVK